WAALTEQLAELLGFLCADGYISREGRHVCFTNNDPVLRAHVSHLWSRCFLRSSHEWQGRSGFSDDATVGKVNLRPPPGVASWLRDQLYTRTTHKQVPPLVLNADYEVQHAFLQGFYAGDELKKGNGRAFKTNSAVLAQGLCWLFHMDDQPASVYVERRA